MTIRRMLIAVFAAVVVTGCANSPTASVEPRRASPGAAFDEVPPPPPPPSATGGIGGMGSGN